MTGRREKTPRKERPAPTRALDRGLRVLEAVAARPNQTLAEIAEACDLSPPTTLRILDTLLVRDFVARDDVARTYGVGLKALEVGSRFLSETRLQETSHAILQRLAEDTGHTAMLAILQGRDVIYIDVREGSGTLKSTPRIGARAPVHATAPGKVLMAWRWAAGLVEALGPDPFQAFTPETITGFAPFRDELGQVREAGVAFDRQEHQQDITCIAAPIRNRVGDVIAALSIEGLTRQLGHREAEIVEALRYGAGEVSQRLGWRPVAIRGQGSDESSPLID